MKVAFNSSPLSSGHKLRGIGTYTKNLLAELKKDRSLTIQEFSNLDEVKNADLVHYPYFDLFQKTLPLRKKFPTVVTIHDVTPLVFSQHYPPGIKGKTSLLYQKISLKNVKAVITDSKCSKKDISKYLSISEDKIFTVYLGVSPKYKQNRDSKKLAAMRKKLKLPDRFALYVGSVNWNKNLLNLTESCLKADMDIVLIGKDFLNQNNLNHPEMKSFALWLSKYSANPKVHVLGYVEDLVGIYNLAEVLLLPSYYEGFGLPILEAQSCGTPVITSKVSSMPEIAGDGAILVDPDNVQNIVDALLEINENKTLRSRLIKNGLKNARNFTWKKCAQEVKNVYQRISE